MLIPATNAVAQVPLSRNLDAAHLPTLATMAQSQPSAAAF